MFKFHHNHRLHFLPVSSSTGLTLSPVCDEPDELIASIDNEHQKGVMTLDPVPDAQQLYRFWSGVEEDLRHDPNWFAFTDDDAL